MDNIDTSDKKKNSKVKKIILSTVLGIASVITLTVVIVLFLLVDKNRCSVAPSNLTISQIYNDSLTESLANLNSESDTLTLEISEDSANSLLKLATSREKSSFIDDIYLTYPKDDSNEFTFYLDLHKSLITTRIVIHTNLVTDPVPYYAVSSITMGKLRYQLNETQLNYVDKVFIESSLPLESHLKEGYILFNPSKLLSSYSLNEVSSVLVASSTYKSTLTSSIGVTLDLSSLDKGPFPSITSSYNLEGTLASKFTNENYLNLTTGENTLLSVSEDEFSSYINSYLDFSNVTEVLTNSSNTITVNASVSDLRVKFTNNEFNLMYEFNVNNFKFIGGYSLGEVHELPKGNVPNLKLFALKIFVKDELNDYFLNFVFDSLNENTNTIEFDKSKKEIVIDFNSIATSSEIYDSLIMSPTSIGIENNSLVFKLTKLH